MGEPPEKKQRAEMKTHLLSKVNSCTTPRPFTCQKFSGCSSAQEGRVSPGRAPQSLPCCSGHSLRPLRVPARGDVERASRRGAYGGRGGPGPCLGTPGNFLLLASFLKLLRGLSDPGPWWPRVQVSTHHQVLPGVWPESAPPPCLHGDADCNLPVSWFPRLQTGTVQMPTSSVVMRPK